MEKWNRQSQLLTTLSAMNEQNLRTRISDLVSYLSHNDPEISINIVDSSIRSYRKQRLVRRKHRPYVKPFEYELSRFGTEHLFWLTSYMEQE